MAYNFILFTHVMIMTTL